MLRTKALEYVCICVLAQATAREHRNFRTVQPFGTTDHMRFLPIGVGWSSSFYFQDAGVAQPTL